MIQTEKDHQDENDEEKDHPDDNDEGVVQTGDQGHKQVAQLPTHLIRFIVHIARVVDHRS